MSDEFNFFDNASPETGSDAGGDVTPSFTPETGTQPAAPSAPALDASYVQQLEERVRAQEQWQKEAARFFGGQAGQPNEPNPQAELMGMLQNPTGFKQQVITEAMQQLQEQSAWDRAIQAEEAAHPHLLPFKNEIMSDSNVGEAVRAFHQKNGRMPNHQETVQAARENFQTRLQAYQAAVAQQQTAAQMQKYALNLTVGGEQASKGPLTVEQINSMSAEDFARLRSRVVNGG